MRFSNFWPGFDHDEAGTNLAPWNKLLYGALDHADVHIGSVFGHSPTSFDLLFSGECVKDLWHDGEAFRFTDHDTSKEGRAKWFMGIPFIDHPQALWVPLFYSYWAAYLQAHGDRSPAPPAKEFGLTVLVRNFDSGSLSGKRVALAHQLSHFMPVHASEALRSAAPPDSQVIYHDVPDKHAFLSRYSHHLCFENHSHAGYLTEKIFDPLYAGALPLYAGDPLVGQWFPDEAYIDCSDLEVEEIVEKIHASTRSCDLVATERENLCKVGFEEMRETLLAFQGRILEATSSTPSLAVRKDRRSSRRPDGDGPLSSDGDNRGKDLPRVFNARHRHWSDLIALHPHGRFQRATSSCKGSWEEQSNGDLLLKWDDWAPDLLARDVSGYRGEHFLLQQVPSSQISSAWLRSGGKPARKNTGVGQHGEWLGHGYSHFIDHGLAAAICRFLGEKGCRTIIDCGCGTGGYVSALRMEGYHAIGVDGNPETEALSFGTCSTVNLVEENELPRCDAVLCLEVGEHVSPLYEEVLLDKLVSSAGKWLILSWAVPGQTGDGHCNERSNDHVTQQLEKRGFTRDLQAGQDLRDHATLGWFGNTLMVFRRSSETTVLPKPRILVGICSCLGNEEKRVAVRETWLSQPVEAVECWFFLGRADAVIDEPDTVILDVGDSYEQLPAKVIAFFRHALENDDFDWLFKCDDDTYVALDRLHDLIDPAVELVGNEFLLQRGSPSGGAGYLLSRNLVAKIVEDLAIPSAGDEDVLIGEAALRSGARARATRNLCWDDQRFPRVDNGVITSHWCPPAQMRRIHQLRQIPPRHVMARHSLWEDVVLLYPDGGCGRSAAACCGEWAEAGGGRIHIKWQDWNPEILIPATDGTESDLPVYDCVPFGMKRLTAELCGGMGNQMFQYAHALSVARSIGIDLNLSHVPYGRQYSLGLFGLKLDAAPASDEERYEDGSGYRPGAETLCKKTVLESLSPAVRIAGFFQNEAYFRDIAGEIRKIFSLPKVDIAQAEGKQPVGIHVRRGDFLGTGHEVCTPAYFHQAIERMKGLMERPFFIVVSDDPNWCEQQFSGNGDLIVMPHQTEGEAMRLLQSCEGFILSNSTFGWWAAWTADRGSVIAPNRFYSESWDVYPSHWITLPPDGGP